MGEVMSEQNCESSFTRRHLTAHILGGVTLGDRTWSPLVALTFTVAVVLQSSNPTVSIAMDFLGPV